ncbi:MAG: hypothetical protein HWN66_08470 [Candidatus Helarchaeota archaeon]|nr:hypothetical protein [Candidatus Helarchaeota archaeon]
MNEKQEKIRFGILFIIQLPFYILFLLSHFLVWGIYEFVVVWPYIFQFTGLESRAGIISIIFLNICLISNYFINIFFFFKGDRLNYNKKYDASMAYSMSASLGSFILSVIGVFVFWQPSHFLYDLLSGIYLWFFSILIYILIEYLFYYNNYRKLRNKTKKNKASFINGCSNFMTISLWLVGMIFFKPTYIVGYIIVGWAVALTIPWVLYYIILKK